MRMSKGCSNSMTISAYSSESVPRSLTKLASGVISDSAMPSFSTNSSVAFFGMSCMGNGKGFAKVLNAVKPSKPARWSSLPVSGIHTPGLQGDQFLLFDKLFGYSLGEQVRIVAQRNQGNI